MKKILSAIYAAIDEINQDLPKGSEIVKSPESLLYGEALDSLGLLTFIVALEEAFEQIGIKVVLSDNIKYDRKKSPYIKVKTLADYLGKLI